MPIELWTARMERPLSEPEREAILPLLPPDRRERLLRMKEVEKQREPLCAYLILCLALRQKYGWKELPEVAPTCTSTSATPAARCWWGFPTRRSAWTSSVSAPWASG